jgi:tRNA pseudouridine55 synthase
MTSMMMMRMMMMTHEGPGGMRQADPRNAILLIDKPEGTTSFEVVREVRRTAGAARAGHTGTLDRFASGLLIVCTGQATKLARFLLEDDKSYAGTVRLGISTDTDERDGAVVEERPVTGITREAILSKARILTGEIMQVPPTYSALKVGGRRASDRARDGETVSLGERRVFIHDFVIGDIDCAGGSFSFTARCSKGTYIRSLARDMGRLLGTGAHLERLRRTGAGVFRVEDAVTPGMLAKSLRAENRPCILKPADALKEYGRVMVDSSGRRRVMSGAEFSEEEALSIDDRDGKTFIILDREENCIAIAAMDLKHWHIKYLSVFNTPL